MRETKAKQETVQDQVGKATNEKKRKNIQDPYSRYKKALAPLTKDQRNMIENYRQAILTGIDKITTDCGLEELENWESIKESFSYEIITPRIAQYLQGEFSVPQACQLGKKLTLRRQGTWFDSLIRKRESLRVCTSDLKVASHYDEDEEKMVYEVTAGLPDWAPPIDPLDPYKTDSESLLLRLEEMKEVKKLPELLGKSGRKHAHRYRRIAEIQLSGVDVGAMHRDSLGAETEEEVRSLKHQTFRFAGEIFAKTFPDLEEKQRVYRTQKGKKWEIKESTFDERKKLYRDPYKE